MSNILIALGIFGIYLVGIFICGTLVRVGVINVSNYEDSEFLLLVFLWPFVMVAAVVFIPFILAFLVLNLALGNHKVNK